MLKSGAFFDTKTDTKKTKYNNTAKPEFVGALQSGLNRRAFIRQSSVAVIFACIVSCKPMLLNRKSAFEKTSTTLNKNHLSNRVSFDVHQQHTLRAVQILLFPDDGDGPSAADINGLDYLEWALTDTDNEEDGDADFIKKGIGWLDSLAEQTLGNQFIELKILQQDEILSKIAQSSTGERWMSLLIYYLMEALLFDPVYGGNPKGVGWAWLKHQPGFPAPDEKTSYRSFL